MYQFDADPHAEGEIVRGTLEGSGADDQAQESGFAVALEAWGSHDESDVEIDEISLDWPVRRQPIVDRNILRLAIHEIRRAGTPLKVAINEAVELAREFGGEKSPGFVNAVLDRVARDEEAEAGTGESGS